MSKFSTFEIQNFQTVLDGDTAKSKVVDLEKVRNFIVDNVFIWICLESQALISCSVQHNMSRSILDKCKWVLGGVVRVRNAWAWGWGSNPSGHKARVGFAQKMCDFSNSWFFCFFFARIRDF
jgi:hypothetical protein